MNADKAIELLRELSPLIDAGEITPEVAVKRLVDEAGMNELDARDLVGELPEDPEMIV